VAGPGSTIAPGALHFLLLAIAGYWAALPQVARMLTGTSVDDLDEVARRRRRGRSPARRPSISTALRCSGSEVSLGSRRQGSRP
jgi:hypothetical protein